MFELLQDPPEVYSTLRNHVLKLPISLTMSAIFEALFRHYSGQLVAANLHAAERGNVVTRDLISRFATAFDAAALSAEKPSRALAENIVFAQPDVFQRAGPQIRAPRKDLINVRPLSLVHRMLVDRSITSRVLPPVDPTDMLAEIRSVISARPDGLFGRPDRLLWIAEKDGPVETQLDWLLSRENVRNAEGASRLEQVMLYYGLPVQPSTDYLVTELSANDWGRLSNDLTYRRPTAFDGVDGDYFKQLRLVECSDPSEWNKAVNLQSAFSSAKQLEDGAWEAVGVPLQMQRITRTAIVLSSSEIRPVHQSIFVDCIKAAYDSIGILWEEIPSYMTAVAGRSSP